MWAAGSLDAFTGTYTRPGGKLVGIVTGAKKKRKRGWEMGFARASGNAAPHAGKKEGRGITAPTLAAARTRAATSPSQLHEAGRRGRPGPARG